MTEWLSEERLRDDRQGYESWWREFALPEIAVNVSNLSWYLIRGP